MPMSATCAAAIWRRDRLRSPKRADRRDRRDRPERTAPMDKTVLRERPENRGVPVRRDRLALPDPLALPDRRVHPERAIPAPIPPVIRGPAATPAKATAREDQRNEEKAEAHPQPQYRAGALRPAAASHGKPRPWRGSQRG